MARFRRPYRQSEVIYEKATHRPGCEMLRMRASAGGASRSGDLHGSEVRLRRVLPNGTGTGQEIFFQRAFVS